MDDVPCGGALLDSGANAMVKYVDALSKKEQVFPVTLASGKTIPCAKAIGPRGMPVVYMVGKSDTDILPLLWLIEHHCKISQDWRTLTTSKGRRLPVVIADCLPYLNKESVTQLLEDLPEAAMPGRNGKVASLNVKVVFSLCLRRAALRAGHQSPNRTVSFPGDTGETGVTDMGHAAGERGDGSSLGISAKMQPNTAHILTQECPQPPAAITAVRTKEERRLRQDRLKQLKKIFEDECLYPVDLPTHNLKKKLDKYKCMPDEYWHNAEYVNLEKLGNIHEMSCIDLQPGAASRLWELMAGSGRLSAKARKDNVTHLPPSPTSAMFPS